MGQVSWLEAALLAFPGLLPQWPSQVGVPSVLGLLTVAGPRRFFTGFRDDPPAMTNCTDSLELPRAFVKFSTEETFGTDRIH